MTFTDADLKKLTEKIDQPGYELHTKRYKALLYRLECAEYYAKCMRAGRPGWYKPQYEAWRKSKGIDADSLAEWGRKSDEKSKGEAGR